MDNKSFINTLAHNTSIETSKISSFIECFAEIIAEECGNENKIALPGFGTFEGSKIDEKIVTDPTTGNNVLFPPSIELEFKSSGMLRKKIKEASK